MARGYIKLKISLATVKKVKDLYYQDDRKPIKIYRMTRIPLDAIMEIIKGEHDKKHHKQN